MRFASTSLITSVVLLAPVASPNEPSNRANEDACLPAWQRASERPLTQTTNKRGGKTLHRTQEIDRRFSDRCIDASHRNGDVDLPMGGTLDCIILAKPR